MGLGVLAAETPHQLLNGLETGMALAGLTWTLALVTDPRVKPGNCWLAILIGTLPFLRPELIVVTLMLLALETCRICHDAGTWHVWTAGAIQKIVWLLSITLAAALPWMLWYAISTGMPFPATAMAKRAFFAEAYLPIGIKELWVTTSLSIFGITAGPLILCALMLLRTHVGLMGLAFFAIFVGAYFAEFPGALGHYEQRYLYVMLPFLIYGAALLLAEKGIIYRIGTTLVVVSLLFSVYYSPAHWAPQVSGCEFTRDVLMSTASWCNKNIPSGTTVLVHDIGYISFATRLHLVDIVGLKTPSSTVLHRRLTMYSAGRLRGEAVNRIALRANPKYLIVLDGWDSIYGISDSLRKRGWKLDLCKSQAYKIYKLTPPGRTAEITGDHQGNAMRTKFWPAAPPPRPKQ